MWSPQSFQTLLLSAPARWSGNCPAQRALLLELPEGLDGAKFFFLKEFF